MADTALSMVPMIKADPAEFRGGVCTIAAAQIEDAVLTGIAFGWTDVAGLSDVAITIDAIEIGGRRFEVMAKFQHVAESGALNLQGLAISGDDGSAVRATGQMVMQGFQAPVLRTINAQVVVTPGVLDALRLDADDAPRAQVNEALDTLDFGQLDRQSRQDILRFAGVMPDARGRLDVSLVASDGVDVAQMILSFVNARPDDFSAILSTALQGAQARLRWNPGRM